MYNRQNMEKRQASLLESSLLVHVQLSSGLSFLAHFNQFLQLKLLQQR